MVDYEKQTITTISSISLSLPKRADTILNLLDALTTAKCVTSLVTLSENPLFKGKFSAIYDELEEGELSRQELASHFPNTNRQRVKQ